MKRYFTLIVSLILAFSLVACNTSVNKDFNANIVKESITSSNIVVHVVIEENTTEDEVLQMIANEVAVEVFTKHQTAIGLNKMTLTIYLFDASANSDVTTESLASVVFKINDSVSAPGLSQGTYQKN